MKKNMICRKLVSALILGFSFLWSTGCTSFFQKAPQASVSPILMEEASKAGDFENSYNFYYGLYKEANLKKRPGAFEYLLKASEARQGLGELDLALAGYFECYENANKANNFNLKIISAQRLQTIYVLLGKDSEAKKYFEVVQKESENIPLVDRDWIFLQLGSLRGYSLSDSSDELILKVHSQTQKYLLRVLNSTNPTVRVRAKDELMARYRDLIRWLQLLNETKAQVEFGSALADSIDQADLYSPNENEALTSEQGDFFEFLDVMKAEVRDWVYRPEARNGLPSKSSTEGSSK